MLNLKGNKEKMEIMNNIEFKTDYKNILVFTHNDSDGILGRLFN